MLNENSTQLSFRRVSEENPSRKQSGQYHNNNNNNTLIKQLARARAELRPVVHSYYHYNQPSKNWSNLRDVLRATHETEQSPRPRERHSFVDLIQHRNKKPLEIIGQIDEELEESLKFLKKYKENTSYESKADRNCVLNEEDLRKRDEGLQITFLFIYTQ